MQWHSYRELERWNKEKEEKEKLDLVERELWDWVGDYKTFTLILELEVEKHAHWKGVLSISGPHSDYF